MTYEDVDAWVRMFDLISNRVGIINQILGARYAHGSNSPLRLQHRRGVYSLTVCGEVFATFGLYDVDSAKSALDGIQSFEQGLWLLNRTGRLNFTECQPT